VKDSDNNLSTFEKELMKKVKEGAIVMSLKRLSARIKEIQRTQRKLFPNSPDLMVRSNLIEITVSNSETLIIKLKKMLDQIKEKKNYFLTFTQGIFETTIIVSKNLENELMKIFGDEKIISGFENLSSITIQLPQGSALIPGIYSFILKALAWEGINLIEVVSTFNEFTMILQDKNIDRAFSILKKLFG
ncbi:MAG: aspartate kinase, partial [Candidatus Aminicenantia bacterium]